MNREEISLQIPAYLSIPETSQFNSSYKNEFVTHARLKMFYVGETEDRRKFSSEFAEKLIKTLPQTPVVAFFDEKKKDFKGHNSTQYVYGYVPETANYSIEKDKDGIEWAFTDVVLFTGRDDNIGDVAAKIIGKQQSLELDPDSFEFKVNREKDGTFKNIEFTEGKLIGLSVVGDNEQAAFAGSSFFTSTNEEFDINKLIAKYKDIKSLDMSCFSVQSNENNNNGGVGEMNIEDFSTTTLVELNNFMKQTYGELQQEVYESALKRFGDNIYLVQLGEESVVFYNYNDGKYMRASYGKNDEGYKFEEAVEVKSRYLTEDEINAVFTIENSEINEFNIVGRIDGQNIVYTELPQNFLLKETSFGNTDFNQVSTGDFAYWQYIPKTNPEDGYGWNSFKLTPEDLGLIKQGANENEGSKEKGIFLTEGEKGQIDADRIELEEFRRGKKEELVSQYAEFLSEEETKEFKDNFAKYSIADLEKELSLKAMKTIFTNKNVDGKNVRTFTTPNTSIPKTKTEQTIDLVNQYK